MLVINTVIASIVVLFTEPAQWIKWFKRYMLFKAEKDYVEYNKRAAKKALENVKDTNIEKNNKKKVKAGWAFKTYYQKQANEIMEEIQPDMHEWYSEIHINFTIG